ncbi:MAG TPA: sugar phosphate isomerase/epimerase family protein [Gaiellaceae bacterium]|nr:sugar phosphate isomerase/epimerase family protein [Gaiellaceae bacterium]
MKLSLSAISTVGASFRDDLRAYSDAGFSGIGIWEMKLGDDDADVDALRASGLRATNCVPVVPSILPNAVIEGPTDVEERVEAMCRSVARLALYEPECVLCLTGAAGDRSEEEARRLVVEGLRRVAAAAEAAGVRLGLEPIHASQRDALSLVTSVPEALELLDEAGLPHVGVMLDLYHVWDTPTVEDDLRRHLGRFTGVHVADWHADGRAERALPGSGVSRTRELIAILAEAGFDGWLDVEIFGTPDDPESFWALSVDEAARRAYEAAVGVLP